MILIPIILLVFLSILFVGHYFVYASVVHFFGITALEYRAVLAAVLCLLPLTFIASAFFAHWHDGRLSRLLYFCSSLWLGVGLTLLTAFALAWAGWGVTSLSASDPNPVWFGVAVLGFTVLYSTYGVWNALHPRVVHYRVGIRNLPPIWQGKKLIQLSDVHLGRILGADFLERIVAKINAQKPAMVLLTGDLFDGSTGNLDELVAPLNRLVAPQGVYFVTGNHETYLGVEHAYAALGSTPVRILKDERVEVDGLQVIGISYPHRGRPLQFSERMSRVQGYVRSLPSVLLYHSPTQIAAAKTAGINLQLSGHVHQGQLFPLQVVTRVMFGKYYHGLHTEGDYNIYTTSGAGVWGPTMRTGNHPEIVVIQLENRI